MKPILLDKNNLDIRLKAIKNSDDLEREKLIQDYKPFIIKTASKATDSYIDVSNSDEYSIALIAFNEAIDKYNEKKGSFLGFAAMVINFRLKDYTSKLTPYQSELKEHLADKSDFTERLDLRNQIDLFVVKLKSFDITLDELVEASPKHHDTRVRSVKMAKHIISIDELKRNFYRLKRLPVLMLSKAFDVTTKTIKRTRKFTIATTIVLDSDWQLIKTRVLQIESGDDNE